MDKIYLHGLQCECVIGVWKWEQQITQTLVLDIDVATDISSAAKSDDLQDTLDYQKLADRVIEFAQAKPYDLMETLIEQLAEMILKEFSLPWVRIQLDKGGAVKHVKHVGIVIERGSQAQSR